MYVAVDTNDSGAHEAKAKHVISFILCFVFVPNSLVLLGSHNATPPLAMTYESERESSWSNYCSSLLSPAARYCAPGAWVVHAQSLHREHMGSGYSASL